MNGTGTQVLKGNGAIGRALSVTKGTLELTWCGRRQRLRYL